MKKDKGTIDMEKDADEGLGCMFVLIGFGIAFMMVAWALLKFPRFW